MGLNGKLHVLANVTPGNVAGLTNIRSDGFGGEISLLHLPGILRGDADKSLARPGRKQATVTKFGIYSTYSTQRSIHSLALAVTFASHSKKIQKIVHPTRAAVTSMLDEK